MAGKKLFSCFVLEIMQISLILSLIEAKLWSTGIAVYGIALLLFVSIEVPCLSAEYGTNGFRRVIWNAMQNLASAIINNREERFLAQWS